MKLHLNPKLFNEYIRDTATNLKLEPDIVEKDYWVTFALKKLSSNKDIVLKGGTSLFKGYNFINRFSEDIDITFIRTYSNQQMDKVHKNYITTPFTKNNNLELYPDSYEDGYQSISYDYPKTFDITTNNLKSVIVVEMYTLTLPSDFKSSYISSLIYQQLKDELNEESFDLEPFKINILSMEQTFIEKIFAINEYIIRNESMGVYTRHIYDIHKMYHTKTIKDVYRTNKYKTLYKEQLKKRISSSRSKIDSSFSMKTCPLNYIDTPEFQREFNLFQREWLFKNRNTSVPYDSVIDSINEICSYLYN